MHEIFHAWNGHTIAQRLVAGGIRRAGEVRPIVREALEAFAFPRRQAPYEQRGLHNQLVLRDVLGIGAFAVAGGEGTNSLLVNEVGGILVLSGTLGRDHIAFLKFIDPLTGKDGVVIRGSQGVSDILLDPDPIPTVLRLPVNGIPSNA